jgi:hypothetical protein
MHDITNITNERSNDYGRAIDQFNTTQNMYALWLKRRSSGKPIPKILENVLNHIVYMCIDKMVRLAENPLKQDGWDDIQGYASLWSQSTDYYEEDYESITNK